MDHQIETTLIRAFRPAYQARVTVADLRAFVAALGDFQGSDEVEIGDSEIVVTSSPVLSALEVFPRPNTVSIPVQRS